MFGLATQPRTTHYLTDAEPPKRPKCSQRRSQHARASNTMRLLNTRGHSPRLEEFVGEHSFPRYAILSHTWEDEEVSLQELSDPARCSNKKGFCKIQKIRALAAAHGFDYTWIDTCCIDKQASSELSEAINSMFRWYEVADVCYAWLSDLDPEDADADLLSALKRCRWFTRGWTLQELIAPPEVIFFDRDWNSRGTRWDLAATISSITRIPITLLRRDSHLSDFSVARRMSWASQRETTRIEDMAYCLLGIFDVNMALIYGERMKAFSRLQETIIQATGDLSILAWTDTRPDCPPYAGFLAESPGQFTACTEIETAGGDLAFRSLRIGARGIEMEAGLAYISTDGVNCHHALDVLSTQGGSCLGVYLRKIGESRYVRWKPNLIAQFRPYSINPSFDNRVVPKVSYDLHGPSAADSTTLYNASKLPSDAVHLLTRLPASTGLHATDLILGNRYAAARVLIASLAPGLTDLNAQSFPGSCWDDHSRLFFCSKGTGQCWAAWLHILELNVPGQPKVGVRFIVACLFWNSQRPLLIYGDLTGAHPSTVGLLRFNLARIKPENWGEAQMMITCALGSDKKEGAGELVSAMGPGREMVIRLDDAIGPAPALCVHQMYTISMSAMVRPTQMVRADRSFG